MKKQINSITPQRVLQVAQPYLDEYKEYSPELKYIGKCLGQDAYSFSVDTDGDDVYIFLDFGETVDVIAGYEAARILNGDIQLTLDIPN